MHDRTGTLLIRRAFVIVLSLLFFMACLPTVTDPLNDNMTRSPSIAPSVFHSARSRDIARSVYLDEGQRLFRNVADFEKGVLRNLTVTEERGAVTLELSRERIDSWVKLRPPGAEPSKRYYAGMTYNSAERRVVLFGGNDGGNLDDTWLFDSATGGWSEAQPPLKPSARRSHAMCYVPETNEVILFGGTSGRDETWTFDINNGTWTDRTLSVRPPRRFGHAMAYVPSTGKVALFGGIDGSEWRNDTWLLDPVTYQWSDVSRDVSPEERAGSEMIYCGSGGHIILFGGKDPANAPLNDTWSFDPREMEWHEINCTLSPPAANSHGMFSNGSHVFVHGGWATGTLLNETWRYEPRLMTWERTAMENYPEARFGHRIVYDERHESALLFGGKDDDHLGECWTFSPEMTRGSGSYESPAIVLPDDNIWNSISLSKTEPPGSGITLTLLNASDGEVIPGYSGLREASTDLRGLSERGVRKMIIRLDFHRGAHLAPTLSYLGIEWGRQDGWCDSFTADERIRKPLDISGDALCFWDFDEGSGTTAGDRSDNSYNATLYGPRWAGGHSGDALVFDGRNDRGAVQGSASLSMGNTLFISAWIRLHGNTSQGTIISKTSGTGHLMDGGFGFGLTEDRKLLLYKGDGVTSGNGNYDFWDAVVGGTSLDTFVWYHVAASFDGRSGANNLAVYLNGELDGIATGGRNAVKDNGFSLYIGAANQGGAYRFHGGIDELCLTTEIPSSDELLDHFTYGIEVVNGSARLVRAHSGDGAYPDEASFRSEDISLPRGCLWGTASVTCAITYDESLTVSVIDSETGAELFSDSYKTHEKSFDLSSLEPRECGSIHFRAVLGSTPASSPAVHRWCVNWTPLEPPRLVTDIPSNVSVPPGSPRPGILDLEMYFHDPYAHKEPPVYAVDHLSGEGNITLYFDGPLLGISNMTENYTGSVMVTVKCTNVYGLSATSNPFSIVVTRLAAPPIWTGAIPVVSLDEDSTYFSPFDLYDLIVGSSEGGLNLSASCRAPNVEADVREDGHLVLAASGNYTGNTTVTVNATWSDTGHSSYQKTNVTVVPVNDPPYSILLSPPDGFVADKPPVTLRWSVFDVDIDDDVANTTCDIYLGRKGEAVLWKENVSGNVFIVPEPVPGEEYEWFVIPCDGKATGICLNGSWSFSVGGVSPDDFRIRAVRNKITGKAGDELSFEIFLENIGTESLSLNLECRGNLSQYVRMTRDWSLPPGSDRSVTVSITLPPDVASGPHELVIAAVSEGFEKEITITIDIDGPEGDAPNESGSVSVVWIVVPAVILVLGVAVVVILVVRERKKQMEDVAKVTLYDEKEPVAGDDEVDVKDVGDGRNGKNGMNGMNGMNRNKSAHSAVVDYTGDEWKGDDSHLRILKEGTLAEPCGDGAATWEGKMGSDIHGYHTDRAAGRGEETGNETRAAYTPEEDYYFVPDGEYIPPGAGEGAGVKQPTASTIIDAEIIEESDAPDVVDADFQEGSDAGDEWNDDWEDD